MSSTNPTAPSRDLDQELAICIHEAGHAVMAVLRGVHVTRVTALLGRADATGICSTKGRVDDRWRYWRNIEGFIDVALGGLAAELVHIGSDAGGATGDIEMAIRLARRIPRWRRELLRTAVRHQGPLPADVRDYLLSRLAAVVARLEEPRAHQAVLDVRSALARDQVVMGADVRRAVRENLEIDAREVA